MLFLAQVRVLRDRLRKKTTMSAITATPISMLIVHTTTTAMISLRPSGSSDLRRCTVAVGEGGRLVVVVVTMMSGSV